MPNWRLPHNIIGSLSACSSFLRQNLEPVDYFSIAAKSPEMLINSLRAVFKHNQTSGLKPGIGSSHFRKKEVVILAQTLTTRGGTPQIQRIDIFFLKESSLLDEKKTHQRYIGFRNYYRKFKRRMAELLNPSSNFSAQK